MCIRDSYTPKVVEESKILDEFNTSKDDEVMGVLEILPDGFGFLRGSNYLSTEGDAVSYTHLDVYKRQVLLI